MKIVIEDQGGNEYLAYTDTKGINEIMVFKPMGATETASITVPVEYAPNVVLSLLKEAEGEN